MAGDGSNIEKAEKKEAEDVERGRELRLAAASRTTESDNKKGTHR